MKPYETPKMGSDGVKTIITSHSLDNVFNSCPRKFEFLSLYDQTPMREESFAADVGTALHEAIQAYLIASAEGKSREDAENEGYLALAVWYPWELEDEQKSKIRGWGETLLMAHTAFRDPEWDNWELLKMTNDEWAVEVAFRINHLGYDCSSPDGQKYRLASQGKMDLVMQEKTTGDIRVRDIKTTTIPEEHLEAQYYHSGQQVGYSHVMHKMLGVDLESFSVDYVIYQFVLNDFPKKHLITLEKTPEVIKDFWRNKDELLTRMGKYIEQGWFPRTNGGCVSWFRPCSMLPICKRRDQDYIKKWFAEGGEVRNREYDYVVTLDLVREEF